MTSTITSKGQLTIPKEIRDKFGLETGIKVDFIVGENGKLEIVPLTSSIRSLIGILPKPKKSLTDEEIEKAIEDGMRE